MTVDLENQLQLLRVYLSQKKFHRDSQEYILARNFLEQFPRKLTDQEEREFRLLLKDAILEPEVSSDSTQEFPKTSTKPFDFLIPKKGWLRKYYDYTLTSEPPAVFHFASAYTVLGAVLGRNVYFDKTFYKVYPNIALVLIAPTGKCRKSSATNIALSLGRAVDLNVLSERITPEALINGLGGRSEACGLVYAPELVVFLGKQRYMDGMVPLLTTLFDAPDVWKSTTIIRGEASLSNVALSMLGASTLEWFVDVLPREAFSGGFMSRLLFVVQEDTDRTFAIPVRPEGSQWESLREDLLKLKEISGEVTLHREAKAWYEKWYTIHHHSKVFDEKFAGYHERKPDHLLRMAMILRIASTGLLEIQDVDLIEALQILDWLEERLPGIFEGAASTTYGMIHQKIIQHLRQAGGSMPHSVLLHKMQHIINAKAFYDAISTLVESETIRVKKEDMCKVYSLIEGKKRE